MPSLNRTTGLPGQDLVSRLLTAGYRPGAPGHVLASSLAVDSAVCCRSRCAVCKHRGRKCQPFRKGMSYRVAAVCDKCSHTEEL